VGAAERGSVTRDVAYRIEDVREAEAAARAVQLWDQHEAAAQEVARLREEVADLNRRVQAAEALAAGLAGRKAIRIAESIQGRRRSVARRRDAAADDSGVRVVQNTQAEGGPDLSDVSRAPAFTIVIPVYNNGSTLMAALDSVRSQTMPNWEVIIWDDGSTDPSTVELLESLNLPNVRRFREVNQGVVHARNSAMQEARGEFTILLDPDDTIEPTYLEKAFIAFIRNPDADVVVPITRVMSEGEEESLWLPPPFEEETISYENIAPIATAFRTRVWKLVEGMSHELDAGFEDWGFWRALAAQGCQAAMLPEPLFRYAHSTVSGRDASARRKRDELELRIKQMFPTIADGSGRGGHNASLRGALKDQVFHIPTGGKQALVILVPWMIRGGGAENFLLSAIPALQDDFVVTVIGTLPVPPGFDDCKAEFLDVTPYVYDLSVLVGEEDYEEVVRSILLRFVNPTVMLIGSAWGYARLPELTTWVRGRPYVVDLLFNHAGHLGRLLAAQDHVDRVLVAHRRLQSLLVDYYRVEPPVDVLYIAPPLPAIRRGTPESGETDEGGTAGIAEAAARSRIRVGWVGRNSPEKRVDLALQIAALGPDLDLAIAGGGLENLRGRGTLPKNVEVMGWVKDARAFIASCDVLLNTSDIEGVSLSAMEALDLGVPVATRDVGGMAELVRDGENGFVYDADDLIGLVRRLTDGVELSAICAHVDEFRLPREFRYDQMVSTLKAALMPPDPEA
jgi:glycosyltransferase involved in cell wall biosynthesis